MTSTLKNGGHLVIEKEAHEDIKSIFNMPSREEAEYMLKKTVEKYAPRASEFAKWIEKRDPGRIDGVQSCARLYRGTAQAENNKYGRISK